VKASTLRNPVNQTYVILRLHAMQARLAGKVARALSLETRAEGLVKQQSVSRRTVTHCDELVAVGSDLGLLSFAQSWDL
jgi:hypothetical protein